MKRILKAIAPYWKTVILIVALLGLQAYCDLGLPQYTSNIIDVGIINGGVDHVLPEEITSSDYEFAIFFMNEEELKIWENSYDFDEESSNYVLNVKSEEKLSEYDEDMAFVIMIANAVSQEMESSANAADTTAVDANQGSDASAYAATGVTDYSAMVSQIREEFQETYDTMGESLIKTTAITYAKAEMEKAGMDMDAYQIHYLIIAGLKMLLMALVIAVATILVGYFASRVAAGIGRDLRGQLYTTVMSFSNAEMDQFSTASLITRTTNDVQQIQFVAVLMLRMILYAPILGIGGVIRVVNTKAGMGWVIALAVVVILGFVGLLMAIALPKFKAMQKLVDRVNLVSREILTGIPVIRAFGREKHEEERFDVANVDLTKTTLFTNRTMTFMLPVMTVLMNGLSVLIVWVSAKRIDMGVMQVGTMTAFLTYAIQIVMSFLMLTGLSIMLPRSIVAAERIDEVLVTKSSIKDAKETKEVSDVKGVIEFDHVDFMYPNAKANVLTDITFTAKPGETTAIIGSTGCGKSTLVNLIPRLYDVTKGKISLDGVDIRDIKLHDLRDALGVVPQKGVLFSGDIESNIKFGRDEASREDVVKAAEIAQAIEFIDKKSDTYSSPIAQGGSNVSGGQKQRLSIARAIAKQPKVYIFDDSFSALDLKTDAKLRAELAKNVSDATVIIVAQRISTILHADQILVMEDGVIVGKGTHKELLENCETYRQIASSQLSKEELYGGDNNGR
ncbi:ABC transporter ATP-binding protein [Lachnospira multipara]|uniref:ATP-binding cassette, subfamily B n=1 Tax=Lachnospira multipara TaxID=28051 RepID=A0A1H5V0D2_9FIRM|nr:ABC transporter ATP-binding protein [Lachnospira multipara]SEF79937.1 ATP-binding cassette, subfamily B [Lachnospira multipara]